MILLLATCEAVWYIISVVSVCLSMHVQYECMLLTVGVALGFSFCVCFAGISAVDRLRRLVGVVRSPDDSRKDLCLVFYRSCFFCQPDLGLRTTTRL